MIVWLRRLRYVFGIGLFLALIAVVGPSQLGQVLGATSPLPLLAAILLYMLMVVIKIGRWLLVLRIQGIDLPFAQGLRAYGLGMLWAAVTPGKVGQHVKAGTLIARGVSFHRAMAGTVVDQLLDFVINAALVPLAVLHLGLRLDRSLWVGLASLVAAGVGLALVARFGRDRFAAAAAEVSRLGRRALGGPLALAALSAALYFLALERCGRAVGIEVGVVTLALATVGAMVIEMAPITVAGLGVREAALLAMLSPYGVGLPQILAFTVLVRAMQVSVGALAYGAGRGDPGAAADRLSESCPPPS